MNLNQTRTASLHLTVHPVSECPNWPNDFRKEGWRPFCNRNATTGMSTWLVKRGESAFAFCQSEYGDLQQDVQLPQQDAVELSQLLVRSGLALPA